MVNARWQLNSDLLLSHGLQKSRLDAVREGKLENLLVANIVVAFRVVLEDGSVRGDNLEIMRLRLRLLFVVGLIC